MRKKNKVVVFTNTNARILTNPGNLEHYARLPNAIVNPDLTAVKSVETHFWKLRGGRIEPMNELEKQRRKRVIEAGGVDNDLPFEPDTPEEELPEIPKRLTLKNFATHLVLLLFASSLVFLFPYFF